MPTTCARAHGRRSTRTGTEAETLPAVTTAAEPLLSHELLDALVEGVLEQWRFAAEPVLASTGQGCYRSAGVSRRRGSMRPSDRNTWLEAWKWEDVTRLNAALCAAGSAMHRITSDGHERCRRRWETQRGQEQTLFEALGLCHWAHRQAPFCFFNGNTFAAIARRAVELVEMDLDGQQRQALRSMAAHYVAGTAAEDELAAFLAELERERSRGR